MSNHLRHRPVLPRVASALVALLALGACGGGSDGSTAEPACVPSGDRLVISADNLEFDRSCLAAPADRPFAIAFTNEENLPHNIEILKDEGSSEAAFKGEIFSGTKTVTYQVPPLAAGTYPFRCTVHPQMKGIVRVG